MHLTDGSVPTLSTPSIPLPPHPPHPQTRFPAAPPRLTAALVLCSKLCSYKTLLFFRIIFIHSSSSSVWQHWNLCAGVFPASRGSSITMTLCGVPRAPPRLPRPHARLVLRSAIPTHKVSNILRKGGYLNACVSISRKSTQINQLTNKE